MSSPACIAIVTGANRLNGLGLACVRQLALQYPSSKFNRGPLLIYLTSRSKASGEAAVQAVTSQIQDAAVEGSPPVEVKLRLLDIASEESVTSFAASLGADHPDGIDILINNAGVLTFRGERSMTPEAVEWTMSCNYYGTLSMTQALLPLIREGGRIVNVSSIGGMLTFGPRPVYSDEIKNRFLRAEKVEDITALVKEFAAAAEKEDLGKDWPSSAYAVSKSAVNGMTRILAKQAAESERRILINCCCPGSVLTDMHTPPSDERYLALLGATKTPDQGAATPVLLALGDIDGQYGLFWRDEKVMEWK